MEKEVSNNWVQLWDIRNEEDVFVREQDIVSIYCDAVNWDDVDWYVQLKDTDQSLVNIGYSAAIKLINSFDVTWTSSIRCPICKGMAVHYTERGSEFGLCCTANFEHRAYAKTGTRHVNWIIQDNFNAGKFGDVDNYPLDIED